MNLRHVARIRGPLLAALGTLLLVGSGSVALANDPPASTTIAVEEPESTGPDIDTLDVQDESGAADVAEAGAPATEGSEPAGIESDGPGGHEDLGQNVDHQFDGEE